MNFTVKTSDISGSIPIPGSKSHTIRALVMALLAEGVSEIHHPLESSDTVSCRDMIEQLGAEVVIEKDLWKVRGTGPNLPVPDNIIDVGNSGTTLYIGLGISSLIRGMTVFTGDHQIRNRPADALIKSINDLGGRAWSTRSNGKPPVVIEGPMTGGTTTMEAVTSQYLSALLIAAPLAEGETIIKVPLLNEQPYVTMTLRWLDLMNIRYENKEYQEFIIEGNQFYKPFSQPIAADFSSATFFLVAAAIKGASLTLKGLDFTDSQGDKEVVNILKDMGADVVIGDSEIKITGRGLKGGEYDLNAIPDALPALAVAGCFAEGETRLVNVPQARLKETDRIAVMATELAKMGADIEERPDGLVIRKSNLKGSAVHGHHDHRIVMSLAIGGLFAEGETVIDTAESVAVTFPNFLELLTEIGGDITSQD